MLSKDVLDTYKPWLISVAKTGSSTLPWIENPRDVDYIFYVTENQNTEKMLKLYSKKPYKECWLIDELGQQDMRIYAYEYHFLEPIYGEDFPTYDVLKHIPEYKEMLINQGLECDFEPLRKAWYHILTGIYLIQNNSYELTEEQIQNVRLCHDKRMTQEIYNFIQEQLLKYREELG